MTPFYSSDILAISIGINMWYMKLYGECLSMSYDYYNKHILYKEMCITFLGNRLVKFGIAGSKGSQSAH
jgi:hypothetical protein